MKSTYKNTLSSDLKTKYDDQTEYAEEFNNFKQALNQFDKENYFIKKGKKH